MVPLWLFWSWGMLQPSQSIDGEQTQTAAATHTAPAPANGNASPFHLDTHAEALLGDRLLLCLNHHLHITDGEPRSLTLLDINTEAQQHLGSLFSSSHRHMFDAPGDLPPQRRAQLRHRDGSLQWYDLDYHHTSDGYTLLLTPCKEQVTLEKQLRKAEMECEYSKRERGEFLRHMSHELRTPLNAILGFARMMESGVFGKIDNEIYEEYLQLIRHSGEDMLSKIVDLMDLSAIGTHHISLKEQSTSPEPIITAALDDVKKIAVSRDVQLCTQDPLPQMTLWADQRLLRKALFQIIKNAVDYNVPGGRVTVQSFITNHDTACIRVADTGKGILPSQLDALQAALQDSSNLYSSIEAYRPIGLGLTLAKEYLHLHDGEIYINSASDEGTTVVLELPATRILPDTQLEESWCPANPKHEDYCASRQVRC
jgi:signal transduction histidine kinase